MFEIKESSIERRRPIKVFLEERFKAWEGVLSDEERGRVAGRLPTHLIALHRLHGVDHAEIRNWYFDYFMQNVKE